MKVIGRFHTTRERELTDGWGVHYQVKIFRIAQWRNKSDGAVTPLLPLIPDKARTGPREWPDAPLKRHRQRDRCQFTL